MSVDQNKALVRRVYERLWNEGDESVVDEIIAPDYVRNATFHPMRGQDGFKQVVRLMRTAFPDHRVTVEDVIGEGDKVVVRWSTQGTNTGKYRDLAPTGKSVRLTGVTVSRLKDGKIAEEWVNWDTQSLLEQLGVISSPQEVRH